MEQSAEHRVSSAEIRKKPAYIFIRFDHSAVQTFRNSITKSKSIIRNYGGRVVCIASHICCKEGYFPPNKSIGVIQFATWELGMRWLQSDPECKQPDWISGADILVVPMEYIPPTDKHVFMLLDLDIQDNERFCNEYIPGHMPGLKASGASSAVVATRRFDKDGRYRGLWHPKMLVVHQWTSLDEMDKWLDSDEYKPWRQLRQGIASSDIVVFEHDTHCDVVNCL